MGNMIEIDEAELASLKGVAAVFNKTLGSKEREKLLRAVKAANPDLPIPEIDARGPVDEAFTGMRDELKAMREQMAADKQAREDAENREKLGRQWNDGRSKVAKQGYSGEALEKLEAFMEEKGVADHEIAAAAFEKLHPQSQPIMNTSNRLNIFGMPNANADDVIGKSLEDLKAGKISDDQFLDSSVNQVLREMRGAA